VPSHTSGRGARAALHAGDMGYFRRPEDAHPRFWSSCARPGRRPPPRGPRPALLVELRPPQPVPNEPARPIPGRGACAAASVSPGAGLRSAARMPASTYVATHCDAFAPENWGRRGSSELEAQYTPAVRGPPQH
jgi:hypothetical protein